MPRCRSPRRVGRAAVRHPRTGATRDAAPPMVAAMTATDITSDTALQLTNLIGGEQLPAASGETFASIDPQDGSVVSVAPRGREQDADRAIAAARAAFDQGPWPHMSGEERGRLLHALA